MLICHRKEIQKLTFQVLAKLQQHSTDTEPQFLFFNPSCKKITSAVSNNLQDG